METEEGGGKRSQLSRRDAPSARVLLLNYDQEAQFLFLLLSVNVLTSQMMIKGIKVKKTRIDM